MQASEGRARTRIQSEQDIEKLRAAALHTLNASDISWDTVLTMAKDMDTAIWALFLSSIGIAIVGGSAVYTFRVQQKQPNNVETAENSFN